MRKYGTFSTGRCEIFGFLDCFQKKYTTRQAIIDPYAASSVAAIHTAMARASCISPNVVCAVCSTEKSRDHFHLGFVCTACCTPDNEPKGICDNCLRRAEDQSVSISSFARKCPFCRSHWPWENPCPTVTDASTPLRDENMDPPPGEGIHWTAPYQFDGEDIDPFVIAWAFMREQISRQRSRITFVAFIVFTLLHHLSIICGTMFILASIHGLYRYPLIWMRTFRLSVASLRLGTAVVVELKMIQYYSNIARAHHLNRLFQNWRKSVYLDGIGIQGAAGCLSVYTSVLLYNLLIWEQKRYRWDSIDAKGISDYTTSNFTCFYFVTFLQAIIMLAVHIPLHCLSCNERGIVHRSYRIAMRALVTQSL